MPLSRRRSRPTRKSHAGAGERRARRKENRRCATWKRRARRGERLGSPLSPPRLDPNGRDDERSWLDLSATRAPIAFASSSSSGSTSRRPTLPRSVCGDRLGELTLAPIERPAPTLVISAPRFRLGLHEGTAALYVASCRPFDRRRRSSRAQRQQASTRLPTHPRLCRVRRFLSASVSF